MKSCKEIVDLLSDYLEGDLPPGELEAFEAHMALCDPCVDFLESLKRTRSLVRGLREEDVPSEVHDQLRSFLDRLQGPRS
ncbi:MAG TPA: zf-HC2 domain-containing protein [Candidatus Polarisedimenticolia bacterium]|nr:zf-HC2 domain-containing protein [Candidatus Polarisedimenticolia bacterium]